VARDGPEVGAEVAYRGDLVGIRAFRHDDDRAPVEETCTERNALTVVAGRCGDEPADAGFEGGGSVDATTRFERPDRGAILVFDPDLAAERLAQLAIAQERGRRQMATDHLARLVDICERRLVHRL